MKVSKTRIAIKNSLNLILIELIHDITHIGVISAVRTMNSTEMPSTPNLNFMKPLIQFFSSMNWKPRKSLSNDHHKNKARKKLAKLVKSEIYIAPLSFLDLKKRINIDPKRGKKIIDDKIGKFII